MNIYNINYFRNKLVWLAFVLLPFATIFAQEQRNNFDESLTKIIEYTEFVYGTDDALVNGQPYALKYREVKGHPFFGDDKWSEETLTVKGKTFHNVKLNYDIESDKLILNTKYNENSYIIIELSNEVIDSFNIQSHHFINAAQLKIDAGEIKFFEQIYKGNFSFLIKHKKILNKAYYDTPPYGRYTKMISVHYIFEKGELKKINSKKSFLKYFHKNKKEIRAFMRKNKIKYKKANHKQLQVLMKYCDNLINE